MTTPTPRQTATDLRTAANVLSHAGHTTGQEVSNEHGSVCLLGAIGIACQDYGIRTAHLPDGMTVFLPKPLENMSGSVMSTTEVSPRARAAIRAVASLLPAPEHRDPDYQVVYGYNDDVCTGEEEAALLLLQAAEKIEADLP